MSNIDATIFVIALSYLQWIRQLFVFLICKLFNSEAI